MMVISLLLLVKKIKMFINAWVDEIFKDILSAHATLIDHGFNFNDQKEWNYSSSDGLIDAKIVSLKNDGGYRLEFRA